MTYRVSGGKVGISSMSLASGGSASARSAVNSALCKAPANVIADFAGNGGTVAVVTSYSWAGYEDSSSAGLFSGGRIELKDGSFSERAVLHEMGHFLDWHVGGRTANVKYSDCEEFRQIMDAEAGAFAREFRGDGIDSRVLSGSGMTAEEYFADAFAKYCTDPSRLKAKCPKTYAFVEKEVCLA